MSKRYVGSLDVGSLAAVMVLMLGCSADASGSDETEGDGANEDGSSNSSGAGASTGTGHEGGAGGASSASGPTSGSTTTSGPGGVAGGSQVSCSGKSSTPGDAEFTVTVDGAQRTYRVHAPPSYDPAVGAPLVLAFHGYLQSTSALESASHLSAAADERGVLVAYPAGQIAGWNAGSCCGTAPMFDVPDVEVAEAVLDQIAVDYCVDDKRVYATGFSNGAMMSYRLACELTDRFAAIAAVSGTIAIDACVPSREMPVLHFHGTSDNVVPYDGGFPSNVSPVDDTIATFVSLNACAATSTPTLTEGAASCEAWCADSARVELCTLDGGGHQWPGGTQNPGGGQVNMDVDASAMILDFFGGYSLP